MAVSKVILNGTTLMDVTQDTVAANKLLSGETATGADGEPVTGNIANKTSSDLTVSEATVTAPAGHYASAASKSVALGIAGMPIATKSAVSNHAVTVTPSVTNTTGYITGSTKTGTGVSVSASELVSGSQTITENGTIDVTNLAEVVVDIDTSPKYTATISGTGSSYTYAQHDSVTYYTDGESFEFAEGDTILLRAEGMRAGGSIVIDGVTVASDSWNRVSYNYSAPASDITISLEYSSQGSVTVETQGSESITVEPLSVTTNGTYTAPSGTAYSPVTVNVPTGGGGLEYETGTWTPSEDVVSAWISFSNTHTVAPFYFMIVDTTETYDSTTNSVYYVAYDNFHQAFGAPQDIENGTYIYGNVYRRWKNSATGSTGGAFLLYTPYTDSSNTYNTQSRFWATETGIKANSANSQYFRANRTYKWIAIWA